MELYLWLLTQDDNTSCDTYDSCIVVATSEEKAKLINPLGNIFSPSKDTDWTGFGSWTNGEWAYHPDNVRAVLIGKAINQKENAVVLTSYIAR